MVSPCAKFEKPRMLYVNETPIPPRDRMLPDTIP
jgi:hypothetical protein